MCCVEGAVGLALTVPLTEVSGIAAASAAITVIGLTGTARAAATAAGRAARTGDGGGGGGGGGSNGDDVTCGSRRLQFSQRKAAGLAEPAPETGIDAVVRTCGEWPRHYDKGYIFSFSEGQMFGLKTTLNWRIYFFKGNSSPITWAFKLR